MDDVTLRPYTPADRDWLVDRHQELYRQDEGFDDSFGPLVDSILRDFEARSGASSAANFGASSGAGHDPTRERGWIAVSGEVRLGSIFCVAQDADTAKLRLFLLVPEARGLGLGKRLLEQCMAFARGAGYRDMVLWTHASHTAACALYAAFGWRLERSEPVHSFGVDLVEQTWSISLQSACIRSGRRLNDRPVPP